MARPSANLQLRWKHTIDDHVIAVGWGRDGATVAAASVSGPITLCDVSTGAIKRQLAGHNFGTAAISWHPDGKRLASAGQDGKVRIWNAVDGTEESVMDGGSAWVEHVAWSPKGDFLVSAAGKRLRLWNADGTLAKSYPDLTHTVATLVWTPNGKEFAAGGYGEVNVVRPDSTDNQRTVYSWKGSLLTIAFSPNAKMLAGGAQDCSVHFWYTKNGEDLEMSGYPSKVGSIVWDHSSTYLATSGSEAVTVWNCSGKGPAGTKPIVLELHSRPIAALAFQHRGPLLASGASDGLLGIWEPSASSKVRDQTDFGEGLSTLAWSPGDGRLLVGGEAGAVGMFTV